MMLEVSNLTVSYGGLTIVDDVSFALNEGEWMMLAGPNGAGKSTMVNAISQGAPYTGRVLINGENARAMKPQRLAKAMGVLTQSHAVGYSFTVEEVVALGRYAYTGGVFSQPGGDNERMINKALEYTGMQKQRRQSVLTLSGGELQRAFLAQVFAQDPGLLLLDEPTNHLDLLYQKQIFALIQDWLKEPGRAVLSVVHDLSLARAYGTRAMLMCDGKNVACGGMEDVFEQKLLENVYGMDVYGWMRQMLKQW